MSTLDSVINATYNVVVSPITLGVWVWKKVHPGKDVVVHNDSCPLFSEIPMVSDTSKIDTSWPPAPHPVEAQSVHDLFAANGKLIRELCYASKLHEEEFQRFLLPVITNLAMIVHLTPASEYDHHQGYGGLFTHSLEVAYYAANEAKGTIFDRSASPKQIHQNKRRWILTAILAALTHDIGKVFTDMTITAPDGQHWTEDEPILTWLRRNNIESYYISFRPGREHNAHKSASLHKSSMLIPEVTFKFLGMTNCGGIMETEYRNALLYGKEGGLIGRILDNADGTSRRADQLRQRQIRPEFKNVSHPQADQLLKAIRVLIQHAIWTTNKDGKSRVFNTKQGCFIVWNGDVASEVRNQALDMGYVSLPSDFMKLATVMADAGIAERNSDEVSNTHGVFWRITPIVLGTIQLDCIKLTDPNFIFDAVPPVMIECIVEGVAIDEETRNAWVKQWKFMPVQRISRDEELQMGYTEDFIEALTKEAEDHIREAEALEQSIQEYRVGTSVEGWDPTVTEEPSSETNSTSNLEADAKNSTLQPASEEDFAGAIADVDEEEFDTQQQAGKELIPISQTVSETEPRRPAVEIKRKQEQAVVAKEGSGEVPEEFGRSTQGQSQSSTRKKKEKKKQAIPGFNMSALLGEDPEDESKDAVDLSTFTETDLDSCAQVDDGMIEPAPQQIPTSNQKEVVQQCVRVQSVHNGEAQDQKSTPEIPIGFVNEPVEQASHITDLPSAKSGTTSLGHLETNEKNVNDESTAKMKPGRGRPIKQSDADRMYNDAENFVNDMTRQMEHGIGLFIMGNLTLDYTSGLLSTSSQAFEQAMRDLGVDELLVEMILEKQAQSDERPRIEWNRQDGKVLFVR